MIDDTPLDAEEEDRDGGNGCSAVVVHAAMSAKARLIRLFDARLSRAGVERADRQGRRAFDRQEPTLGGHRTSPSIAPHAGDYDDQDEIDDEEEDEEDEAPVARAPRKKAAPKQPARKAAGKFELPPVVGADRAEAPPIASR